MPPAERTVEGLALLDEVEARWRDALSFVAAEDPRAAAREVEQAGALLRRLGPLDAFTGSLGPGALAEATTKIGRLTRLHHRLLAASHEAQVAIGRQLGQASSGKAALAAYGEAGAPEHACDEIG